MNNLLKHVSENFPSFSKGQKKIATFISENTEKAAFMTAQKKIKRKKIIKTKEIRKRNQNDYKKNIHINLHIPN